MNMHEAHRLEDATSLSECYQTNQFNILLCKTDFLVGEEENSSPLWVRYFNLSAVPTFYKEPNQMYKCIPIHISLCLGTSSLVLTFTALQQCQRVASQTDEFINTIIFLFNLVSSTNSCSLLCNWEWGWQDAGSSPGSHRRLQPTVTYHTREQMV